MSREDLSDGWLSSVHLPDGNCTRSEELPDTRLNRIVQIIADQAGKPLSQCRILDLGCLEGQFTVELALQGASAIGIEVRRANLEKAEYLKNAFHLSNVEFHQDDARNISVEKYGSFDAIICSGLLYHLTARDALRLLHSMYTMCHRCLVIDTHISLVGSETESIGGQTYHGHYFFEHHPDDPAESRERRRLSSADNETSFWFTHPSLVNAITDAGFSKVYECFVPAHLNYGKPGLQHIDRCAFIALKSPAINLVTSPSANALGERFPENSLSYAASSKRPLWRRVAGRLKRLVY